MRPLRDVGSPPEALLVSSGAATASMAACSFLTSSCSSFCGVGETGREVKCCGLEGGGSSPEPLAVFWGLTFQPSSSASARQPSSQSPSQATSLGGGGRGIWGHRDGGRQSTWGKGAYGGGEGGGQPLSDPLKYKERPQTSVSHAHLYLSCSARGPYVCPHPSSPGPSVPPKSPQAPHPQPLPVGFVRVEVHPAAEAHEGHEDIALGTMKRQ